VRRRLLLGGGLRYGDRARGGRAGAAIAPVLGELEELGVFVQSFSLTEAGGSRHADIDLDLPHGARPEDVFARLGDLDDVAGVRWMA
jgi:hypothetical protein